MIDKGHLKGFFLGAALALAGALLAELLLRVGFRPFSPLGVPGLGTIIAAALVGVPGILGGAGVVLAYYLINLGYPERFPQFFSGMAPSVTWALGIGAMTICAGFLHARVRRAERAAAYDRALRDSEAHFRSLTELSSDYYWEQDENFRFISRISSPDDKTALPVDQVIGKARWELPARNMTEADWARHRADLEAHREFRDLLLKRIMADGSERWISTSGRPVYDDAGRFIGYRGIGRNVTEEVVARNELAAARERLEQALDGSNVALWDADLRAGRVFLSEAWARIIDAESTPSSMTVEDLLSVVHPDDRDTIRRVSLEAMKGLRPAYALEHRVRSAKGEWKWILSRGRVTERDPQSGRALRMIGTNLDISDRKRIEDAMRSVAESDPLTGLATRVVLSERIRAALARHRRSGACVALLYLDIDRFKQVNDSLGHAAGDALLKAFAARLRSCVRGSDTVARLGGDEFVVVLDDVKERDNVVQIAQKVIEAARAPLDIEGRDVAVTVSIGIAFAEAAPDDAALLKLADSALYEAKTAGRNVFRVAA